MLSLLCVYSFILLDPVFLQVENKSHIFLHFYPDNLMMGKYRDFFLSTPQFSCTHLYVPGRMDTLIF